MNNPVKDNKNYQRTTRDTSYWHGMPVMYMGTYYPNKLFRHFDESDSNSKQRGFRVVRNKS